MSFRMSASWRTSRGCSSSSPLRSRSEEHTSELQSHLNLVCRLLLEKTNCRLFIAESFKRPTADPRIAYPFVPNHSTTAAPNIRDHATPSTALKASTLNSVVKSVDYE